MIRKKFVITKDHWIMLQAAVEESLAEIFPAGQQMMIQWIRTVWRDDDRVEVIAQPQWFEDMKAALAAHPEPEVGEYYIGDIDTLFEMSEDVCEPAVREAGQSLVEFSLGLVLVALAFIILAALLGPAISQVVAAPALPDIAIPEKLGELPMIDHAVTAHAGQKYNALNLIPMWDNDQCNRKLVYFCPKQEKFEFFCEVEPTPNGGVWGGIVVGYRGNTPIKIVTAYPGSWTYWVHRIRTDGCVMVGMP